MSSHEELCVDGARLRRSLEAMAEIGATPGGGMHGLTLSDDGRDGSLPCEPAAEISATRCTPP